MSGYGSAGKLALLLSVVSLVGVLFTTLSPYWKINSQVASQNVNVGIAKFEGVWIRCTSTGPGQFQCDGFDDSFLGLTPELQAQRAMMVLAAICAVTGVLCGGLGMDCVVAMGDNNAKPKIYTGRTGGGCMLLGGILTLVSVSWYSSGIVFEYFNPNLQGAQFKYEFGPALYVGWVSSVLAIIAGILLLCCNCGATEETDDYPYNYGPAKPVSSTRPNTEYV